jgi:hypothetical protein
VPESLAISENAVPFGAVNHLWAKKRNPSFRTIYLLLILILNRYFRAKMQGTAEFFNTNTALEMK